MSIHSKSVSSINAPSGCFLLNCASILLSVHFSLFLILCFPFCFRMRLFGCWEISEEQWGFGFLSWVGFLLSLLNLEEDQTKSSFFRFLFLFYFSLSLSFMIVWDDKLQFCFAWSDTLVLLTFVVNCFCWTPKYFSLCDT